MTLEEALNYSLKVSWIVEQCNKVDVDCVGVVPEHKILFKYPDATIDSELEIMPFGFVDPILAQHIVKLHNDKLKQDKIISDSMSNILTEEPLNKDYGISQ